jgi:hypothetical protein
LQNVFTCQLARPTKISKKGCPDSRNPFFSNPARVRRTALEPLLIKVKLGPVLCELLDNAHGRAIDFVYHVDNTGATLLISIDSYSRASASE